MTETLLAGPRASTQALKLEILTLYFRTSGFLLKISLKVNTHVNSIQAPSGTFKTFKNL